MLPKSKVLLLVDQKSVDWTTNYIVENFNEIKNKKTIKSKIINLVYSRKQKINSCNRNVERFKKIYHKWLQSSFFLSKQKDVEQTGIRGRPKKNFESSTKYTQFKKIKKVSEELQNNATTLIKACRHAAKKQKNKNLYYVLDYILENPDLKFQEIINTPRIIKKTPEEALAFLLESNFSKFQYQNLRKQEKKSNVDIWPPYNVVRETKVKCRPPLDHIKFSENKAECTLQALLNHTAQRIVLLQEDVITQYMEKYHKKELDVLMFLSWGFDGSSGFSGYKQPYHNEKSSEPLSDQNLFITSLNPLRITTDSNIIIWNNKYSQSPRSCRPISLQYSKESRDLVLETKANIERQIENLQYLVISLKNNLVIKIHFNLFLTLIDGKILNILTNTKSMQTCPICKAKPKTFNDLVNITNNLFIPDHSSLQHGLSPLHAWIRIYEFLLQVSYRIDIKEWHIRGKEKKTILDQKKKSIQKLLWDKLGLIVSKPKANGYGNTNDGNSARKAFQNPKLLAEYLELNPVLIQNFKTILMALSSHIQVDPIKFGELCSATAILYVSEYPWYPMTATAHKILMHGATIMQNFILPIGIIFA